MPPVGPIAGRRAPAVLVALGSRGFSLGLPALAGLRGLSTASLKDAVAAKIPEEQVSVGASTRSA